MKMKYFIKSIIPFFKADKGKKFYKRRWFFASILLLIVLSFVNGNDTAPSTAVKTVTPINTKVTPIAVKEVVKVIPETIEANQNKAFQERAGAVIQKTIDKTYKGDAWQGVFLSINALRGTKGNIFLEVYTSLSAKAAKDGSEDVAKSLNKGIIEWDIYIANTPHKIISVKIFAMDGSILNKLEVNR
jgi:hypothetical protein